ncbi:MAG: Gfo/Idh/MocA family oxidoreductase [Gemmatimonadetes bacterium]|nr:Gfo/Idh/MocA family oxidoreductase [Gemmatimonadota bacterium]
MSRLKVGVIGAGAWGRNHVRTLATMASVELAGVADADAKVRERTAKTHPGVFVTGSVEEVLARVDAVVVASTAKSHAQLGLQALGAGKPVLIEKPFALTVADARAVAEASRRLQVPALVGHLLEFHPVVDHLRGMIQSGALGDLYYLASQRVNLGQVRPDENALWSFGPHDISVALYLLGEAPVSVTAHGYAYLQPGIEDVVFLGMRFRSGVVAHAHLSWLDPHKERRLTVVGSKQMAVFDDMAPREKLRIYDKGISRPPEYGSYGESLAIREGDIWIPKVSNAEPLGLELAHFVAVARGATPTRADADDGVRVVQVLDAASRSLRSGGAPVLVEE